MCLCCVNGGTFEPGQLARELALSPSRLTRILDRLAERKMIERDISKIDRRSMVISLTKQGIKIIEKYKCANIEIPEELAFTQKG
jgi:DNA-binding MarR family transcriptional regulator